MLLLNMKGQSSNRPIISKNIIKYRKTRGLSQTQLAELCGVSRRMIAHYETNISNPPINNLLAIAKALSVTLNDLLGDTNKDLNYFKDIETRTLRKIMLIGKLPKKDRVTIYNMIDALIKKNSMKAS